MGVHEVGMLAELYGLRIVVVACVRTEGSKACRTAARAGSPCGLCFCLLVNVTWSWFRFRDILDKDIQKIYRISTI